jgi:hypothetical protein
MIQLQASQACFVRTTRQLMDIVQKSAVLLMTMAAFGGAGAGIAYGIAKPKFEERLAKNRAEVAQVFGTPCYINRGVVVGNELQRESAILVNNVSETGEPTIETLFVTFIDDDLVFFDAPSVGLCGTSGLFWVLNNHASLDFDKAVTYHLKRPEQYCLQGAGYGLSSMCILCIIGLGCTCMYLRCYCCRNISKYVFLTLCCNRSQLRADREDAESMSDTIEHVDRL